MLSVQKRSKSFFESFLENNIEVVLARYEEDIDWLKEPPFNICRVTCYNKGSPIKNIGDFKNVKVINLKNVGRCDHTYLYHIVSNYGNLADVTIFLPASCMDNHKKNQTYRVISNAISSKNTVFVGQIMEKNIRDSFYNFYLDEWKATNPSNASKNPESALKKCVPRPYGKWYDANFSIIDIHIVCYYGIFAVAKKHIEQHPKQQYEKLLKYVDDHSNPEAGHYMERSWGVIFYPYEKECINPP